MRKRFEQQLEIGLMPISETPVFKSRDDIPALVIALLKIFNTPEYNTRIFSILEEKILKGKKKTGRMGLSLWQIFVLAEFRHALNLNIDRLHYMTNSDSTLRQLLGIEREAGFKKEKISLQRIKDNMNLLDEETLLKINDIIVEFGHKKVFKKKEEEALRLKTDSFVVQSTVHFPTDYSLLRDSSRKALDIIKWFKKKYSDIEGWRKINDWYNELKNLSRTLGTVSSRGGRNRQIALTKATKQYLTKVMALRKKLLSEKDKLPASEMIDLLQILELERFIELMDKHIDLVERRLIKGEKIPHEEKMFSIFEEYTEWIVKGKLFPPVELGKKTSITTDQYHLIVDVFVHDHQADSEVILPIAKRVLKKYSVDSLSTDKGYWNKDNKETLQGQIPCLVMPKKGKLNQEQYQQEHSKEFIKLRNKHSAVESNINEVEHRGLNRCPDKGYDHFKRYIAATVTAYNLHRIGKEMLKQKSRQEEKLHKKKRKKTAA